MTRNVLLIGTVAIFGLTAAIAGAGDATNAVACDDATKSAAVSTSSCCAKGEAKSASVDAKRIRGGAYQTANVSAKGACTATAAAKAGCAPKDAAHASLASMPASCTASAGIKTANASDCDKTSASAASMAAGCCAKDGAKASAAAAGGDGCASSAAAGSKENCAPATTASLKGVVDEMPYRESKKVVLTGAYACGHCQLQKTEACSPMFKTAEGKVYPMLQSNHVAEIKAAKAANLQVTGVVKKVDGVKFIDVKSYKVI